MSQATSTANASGGKTRSAPAGGLEPSLYAKRQKVYPREVHGLFASLRVTGVVVLMGVYYLLPWVQWKGQQAVLLDLPDRKFHFFELTFWPQDFIYLTSLLIIAALSLFFFTALAGRLWCGYACPQTVWTEVFLWIERRIEGDRGKQIKLDKEPWSVGKVWIKGIKHLAWIGLAFWTGYTFVGYFTPIRELGVSVLALQTGPWETFWILFYGFATYGNAGWLREQVCIYMCPYARFQSAMFDENTLIISYDKQRGEPRGPRRKSDERAALDLGDCVDCTICVQVCPTGIDIRDGLQNECIGCAACIDACDDVMDRMDYPRGLIRYTTENALAGRKTRILRPRVVVYGLILLSLLSALVYGIASRVPVDLDVIRDRNTLYRETPQGLVENVYTLKLLNMDREAHLYDLTVEGLDGVQMEIGSPELRVPAGEVSEATVRLWMDPFDLNAASNKFHFTLTARDDRALTVTQEARFLGPSG